VPEHAVRVPCGAPATAVQVPTLPPTSHASHCPPHDELQHTPSTQLPDEHSCAPVGHDEPFDFLPTQLVPLQ
jgi:hypothetical protein